jgi:hypothetical protein
MEVLHPLVRVLQLCSPICIVLLNHHVDVLGLPKPEDQEASRDLNKPRI